MHPQGARYANLDRIHDLLAASPFDVVVSTWPENTAYLSGFYHPDMRLTWERLHIVVWPSGGEPVYVVPAPRADTWNGVASDTWGPDETRPHIADIRGYDGEGDAMVDVVADVLWELDLATGHIGVEARATPFKVTARLAEVLPDLRFGDAWPLLNEMRKVKTAAEVDLLTHVNRLTAARLEHELGALRAGETERAVAARVTDGLFRAGAQELTHSVFGAGARGGQWHPWPTDAVLEDGMLIRTDWGVRIDGYASDIARTAVVGRASRAQRTRFDRISAALDVVVDAARPGVVAGELVELARRTYTHLGEEFRWPIVGHGIGLVLHEEPHLVAGAADPIVEGMTLEIELGWVDASQGHHVEDLVHVGRARTVNLTRTPGHRGLIEARS